MNTKLVCLLLVFISGCAEHAKTREKFFESCEKTRPYHECKYLYEAMNSGCESDKAMSAAMVGGIVGASMAGGRK